MLTVAVLGFEGLNTLSNRGFAACPYLMLSFPEQVMVIPISEASRDYAAQVRAVLRADHFYVDVDNADKKMQKKIREAQLEQYNYILVRSRDRG
jgi:threonyl-tRNA synthetase